MTLMRKIFLRGAMAAALMGSSFTLPSLAGAETLNDALRWAYQDNPDLNAARASVKSQLANVAVTNAPARPQLNFSSTYEYAGSSIYSGPWQKGDSISATVSASLLLYDGGQTGLATDAAMAQTLAANYRLKASEQQILLQTVAAYVDVLRSRALILANQNNINALDTRSNSARVAFDAGAATITEISQTEAAVAQARTDLASAQAQLASAEAEYARLTGRQPGDLQPIQNLPPLPSTLAEAQRIGAQVSPLVIAAVESERAAHYDLRRAEAGRMPQINLNVQGTRTNNLDGVPGFNDSAAAGIRMDIPLYTGGRIEGLERQARAALEARAQETTATRIQAEANVAAAWAQLQDAQAANKAMEQVVEAQDLADQGAEIEYEVGALTVTDRLDAQQDLIAAKSNLLGARYQRQFAVYNVLQSMGQLTIDQMGLNIAPIDPLSSVKTPDHIPRSQEQQVIDQISDRWAQPDP